jgi:hypothetical protein
LRAAFSASNSATSFFNPAISFRNACITYTSVWKLKLQ